MDNVNEQETSKFAAQADKWWDVNGVCKVLHAVNPVRLNWIAEHCKLHDTSVLDIGCGGGILAEGLAKNGAKVTAIDASDKLIMVAKNHAKLANLDIDYMNITAEDLSKTESRFAAITCMELLEHVPCPMTLLRACYDLLESGGKLFVSTLNRNLTSYIQAILGAEYLLKILPKGTHDYQQFIQPAELQEWLSTIGFMVQDITGVAYNPLLSTAKLCIDAKVNYILYAKKI